ncbi:MAG TPA: 4-hydroxy-tetrahydrodipicolinate synthase [Candidatus Deferrimicrobium sp.]|nr:4-hydroxy-tetrahydrodipicolinate synthase [Candidatus Deferrimicrobium sp.]
MKNFGRVLTAMVTPFKANHEVDYEQAKVLARYLVNNGSDGIVVVGTTGESPTLTFEEKINMYAVVKEAVGDQAVIIAGTGSNDTAGTIKLTKAVERVGVDAVMLVVPYYNKPSQEGIYQHFATVAGSTNLPVMLYNVPGRTGINLLPSTVARLAQISNIVALKEAAGSTDQVTELKRLLPQGFMIYSGDDSMTLPLMALGCEGIISVVSHVVGQEIQEMIQAFLSGDLLKAAKIHYALYPIFKGMFMTSNPVPIKAALNMLGIDVGPVRLPLVNATEMEKVEIRKLLLDAGKELTDNRVKAAGVNASNEASKV